MSNALVKITQQNKSNNSPITSSIKQEKGLSDSHLKLPDSTTVAMEATTLPKSSSKLNTSNMSSTIANVNNNNNGSINTSISSSSINSNNIGQKLCEVCNAESGTGIFLIK